MYPRKGMSLEDCVKTADRFISQEGLCLLLFDVVNSRKHSDRRYLNDRLKEMMADFNDTFADYFPLHDIAVRGRYEKGFQHLLGDGSWAGINSLEVIPKIMDYHSKNYEFALWWNVARNGYDEKNIKIVR